jgi:hypothetical protein
MMMSDLESVMLQRGSRRCGISKRNAELVKAEGGNGGRTMCPKGYDRVCK